MPCSILLEKLQVDSVQFVPALVQPVYACCRDNELSGLMVDVSRTRRERGRGRSRDRRKEGRGGGGKGAGARAGAGAGAGAGRRGGGGSQHDLSQVGYSETCVLPVYHGHPLVHAMSVADVGTRTVHDCLAALACEKELVQWQSPAPEDAILDHVDAHRQAEDMDDVVVRSCSLHPDDEVRSGRGGSVSV